MFELFALLELDKHTRKCTKKGKYDQKSKRLLTPKNAK